MHVLGDGSRHIDERTVAGRGRHAIGIHVAAHTRVLILLSMPSIGLRQSVVPIAAQQSGFAGHVRLVSTGISHDDHGIPCFILILVSGVELDSLRTFERQDALVKQLPAGFRIGIGRCLLGGGRQHLRTLKERGLAVGDVASGSAAFLVLGEAVVVVANLDDRGVDTGIVGILPHHRFGEGLEVAGDAVQQHVVRVAGIGAGHRGGTGVVGVHT